MRRRCWGGVENSDCPYGLLGACCYSLTKEKSIYLYEEAPNFGRGLFTFLVKHKKLNYGNCQKYVPISLFIKFPCPPLSKGILMKA